MSVIITEMTLSDLEKIEDILTTDFDDFWNKKVLEEELSSSSSKYIVAKSDNEIVGFAGLKIVLDEADIMNIVTRKNYRRQGIGSLLLKNLIMLCENSGTKSIALEVNENNSNAIGLYLKFGFQHIGVRKNYYKNENAIIMKKNLLQEHNNSIL